MRRWNIFSIISVIVAAWLVLSASVMWATDAAPGALVFFPSTAFMQNLPDETAVTGGSNFFVTLSSTEPHLTRKLYSAGAWLVLPAGLEGCLKPPSAFR
jgi:hypothetical protein